MEDVMLPAYDKNAVKRNVNLSVNADLVRLARERKINLSALLEESLVDSLRREELRRWKEESRESFESYNQMVAEHGLLSDDLGLL
jgi:antitoxin CcdA